MYIYIYTNAQIDMHMYNQICISVNACVCASTYGWKDGWVGGWMDGVHVVCMCGSQ